LKWLLHLLTVWHKSAHPVVRCDQQNQLAISGIVAELKGDGMDCCCLSSDKYTKSNEVYLLAWFLLTWHKFGWFS